VLTSDAKEAHIKKPTDIETGLKEETKTVKETVLREQGAERRLQNMEDS
jgi:hypothetical protein